MKRAWVAVVVVAVAAAGLFLARCSTKPAPRRDAPAPVTKRIAPQIAIYDAGFDAHVREKTDVELSGTVQDITGGVIAGAIVRVGVQRTVTDASGAFSLWMKPGDDIEVHAVADGYGATHKHVTVPNHVQLLLTPEGTIDGIVVDQKGPVAGVLVEAIVGDAHPFSITDAGGGFHIASLEPGRYVVTARTPHGFGQAPGTIGIALGQHVTGVVIHLDAAVRITGRIEGCKEPEAELHVFGERYADVSFLVDPDGLLRAEGVRDGRYTGYVQCPHMRSQTLTLTVAGKDLGPFTWKLEPGEDDPIELDDSATVHGIVTDETGKGIAARVSANGEQDAAGTETTGAGTYSMKVRPGTYDISAGHDAWHPGTEEKQITLAPDQDLELNFTIKLETGVIRGDVKDATGNPVADAFVEAWIPASFDDLRFVYDLQPVVTDKDGAFVIDHLQKGIYNVEADRRGGGTGRANGVELGSTIHLVIPELGSIAGTVSYRDGKLPDWFVLKIRNEADRVYRQEEMYHSHGAFAVNDLPGGEYTIAIVADDGFGAQTLALAAGETKKGLAFPIARKTTLRGRLVDDNGTPIPGWKLVATTKQALLGSMFDWSDTSNESNANGVFAIQSPPGPIELLIGAPGALVPHHMPCRLTLSLDVDGAFDVGTLTIVKPCTLRR